ncbi:MAG: hypothetical protein IC227_00240 [Enterococcus lacertideformus]|uniref:Uncharacterized protein n=1 Tax=Enterococcus lacertideformus TaxID=2771493 RepID=A0A931ATN2_9ENTE|nr:hypothetical protein [Enterococcus lacertideformus]
MYTLAIFIILMGIIFLCVNFVLFLNNYKKVIIGQVNKSIIYINVLLLMSSIFLLILGIVYYIVINQQL